MIKNLLPVVVSLLLLIALIILSCRKDLRRNDNLNENKPPVAHAGNDTVVVLPQDSFLLDGTASYDSDGSIDKYLWSKISGPSSSTIVRSQSVQATIKNLSQGIYQVELTITDNGGLSAKDTVMITVDSVAVPNHPPVANAGQDHVITLPTDTVTLDGSQSADPDNNITAYQWTKVSGPSSLLIAEVGAVKTQVSALVEGVYHFELKITDNKGLTGSDTVQVKVNGLILTSTCVGRPFINATLVPIGSLSSARSGIKCATAGNKIMFAGGWTPYLTSDIDIYDFSTNTWSTSTLTREYGLDRAEITIASVGDKILLAGGSASMGDIYDIQSSKVDIYNATSNTWSTANLSEARHRSAATSVGNKVVFAGGGYWVNTPQNYHWVRSNVVDIFDNTTNTWTSDTLGEAREGLSATTVGSKVYFAGGETGSPNNPNTSKRIDILDMATNSWSVSSLQEEKAGMASISVGNTIFWAGGYTSNSGGRAFLSQVEIRNLITGNSSFACMIPKTQFSTVMKDDNIIFFTGLGDGSPDGSHFEIYNISSDTWSTGVLSQKIIGAAIISVNNTIYVAGGTDGSGIYYNQVWKLEF